MVSFRACQTFLLMLAIAVVPAFAAPGRRAETAAHHTYHHHYYRHTRYHRSRHHYRRHVAYRRHIIRGQRGIDPARATQIQDALIKQHYMTGPASGQWDDATEQAMQKYQAAHGWQTKYTPDSRALISLGLGPNHNADGTLLNKSTFTATADNAAPANPIPANPVPTDRTLASIHIIQN